MKITYFKQGNDSNFVHNVECPLCGCLKPKIITRNIKDYLFLSCPLCSFQFIHSPEEARIDFSDYPWTREYTENYGQYLDPVLFSLRRKIEIVEKLINRRPSSFFDVGCGNGLYLKAAETLGLRNFGIDLDHQNIEFARTQGLRAMVANLESLKLDEKFDFIHLKAVLHLVPKPVTFIKKLEEFLETGGVIYLDVPNQGSLYSKLRIIRDRSSYGQLQPPFRRGAYKAKSLEYLFRSTDMEVLKKVFIYPGDKVYYPNLRINKFIKIIFMSLAVARIASMIGFYIRPKKYRYEK
jgi:2-polyprenyl-3-methyl-5-hydroxy-6-metoxy-1,4-benzoquinol methylase